MAQTILFIDGENFLHKVEETLNQSKPKATLIRAANVDVKALTASALNSLKINKTRFYAAKLHYNEQTPTKSKQLIAAQRKLRNILVNQGVEFILAGNVRSQTIGKGKRARLVFQEKGVDVRIAVDMVSMACDKKLKTAILCSSDSDLQPAVTEMKKRGVEIIYLGFETKPNKGLIFTCDRTILLRNTEILRALK